MNWIEREEFYSLYFVHVVGSNWRLNTLIVSRTQRNQNSHPHSIRKLSIAIFSSRLFSPFLFSLSYHSSTSSLVALFSSSSFFSYVFLYLPLMPLFDAQFSATSLSHPWRSLSAHQRPSRSLATLISTKPHCFRPLKVWVKYANIEDMWYVWILATTYMYAVS